MRITRKQKAKVKSLSPAISGTLTTHVHTHIFRGLVVSAGTKGEILWKAKMPKALVHQSPIPDRLLQNQYYTFYCTPCEFGLPHSSRPSHPVAFWFLQSYLSLTVVTFVVIFFSVWL